MHDVLTQALNVILHFLHGRGEVGEAVVQVVFLRFGMRVSKQANVLFEASECVTGIRHIQPPVKE